MRTTSIQDIAKIRCANRILLNEAETLAAYCVFEPDEKTGGYQKTVWLADMATYAVKQLTQQGNDGWFIWDDNETLLLNGFRGKEKEKNSTVYYRMPVNGGEPKQAFTIPLNVTEMKKLSAGRYIVRALEKPEEEENVHVFEEAPFWTDGSGFTAGNRSHLYVYEESGGILTRITDGNCDVGYFTVQNGQAAFIACTWQNVQPETNGLYLYDDAAGIVHTVRKEGEVHIAQVTFCGKDLVYTASDLKKWGTGQLHDFWIWYAENEENVLFAKNDQEIAIGDTPYSDTIRMGGTMFRAAGRIVYFTGMRGFTTGVWSLDPYGNIRRMLEVPQGVISCFDAGDSAFVFIAAEPGRTQAVYTVDETDTVYCIDDLNKEYLEETVVSPPEYVPFESEDGSTVDGWVIYPADYEEGKQYPGILEIHGGPRGAYGTVYYHEMQSMAAAGYFVFYCNPHGSEGYGERFADLRGKYGEIDYRDLMTFTDHVLEQYPMIDPKRICASGGSYGGFMCNWIEGHTDRFAAIAAQRSVSNWVSDMGTSQIGLSFDMNEMGTDPWKDAGEYWRASPLRYADQASTPLLLLHSTGDYNCFIDQAAQMFSAMKYHGVPARMVVFDGESHALSRSGSVPLRIRRLDEIISWFDRWTKNMEEE
ncbi:MAG: S9 family peptidase [Solobacterium sp.]|nr:S9 family peptidase [Solobacterium sp.]